MAVDGSRHIVLCGHVCDLCAVRGTRTLSQSCKAPAQQVLEAPEATLVCAACTKLRALTSRLLHRPGAGQLRLHVVQWSRRHGPPFEQHALRPLVRCPLQRPRRQLVPALPRGHHQRPLPRLHWRRQLCRRAADQLLLRQHHRQQCVWLEGGGGRRHIPATVRDTHFRVHLPSEPASSQLARPRRIM